MSKCTVCREEIHLELDPRYAVCSAHAEEWGASEAYHRALAASTRKGYDRQVHDWADTKRRERLNGAPPTCECRIRGDFDERRCSSHLSGSALALFESRRAK